MLKKSLVLSAVLAASLNAGMFGDLAGAALGGGSSAAAVSSNDIKGVLSSVQEAETGLNNSVSILNLALGDKQTIAKLGAMQKKIDQLPQGKEKDAQIKQNKVDQDAALKIILAAKETEAKAKNLSTEQKKKVGTAIGNLLLVTLKDVKAVNQGKSFISSISANPTASVQYASDLPKLKDIVTNVPSQISSLGTMTASLTKLASSADIKYNANPKVEDKIADQSNAFK